jgi:hypothetical protein
LFTGHFDINAVSGSLIGGDQRVAVAMDKWRCCTVPDVEKSPAKCRFFVWLISKPIIGAMKTSRQSSGLGAATYEKVTPSYRHGKYEPAGG